MVLPAYNAAKTLEVTVREIPDVVDECILVDDNSRDETAEVARRIKTYLENDFRFLQVLNDHTRIDGNVIITDFRKLASIPVGNRFLVYTLYPECNVSVRVQWGPRKAFIATTIGHSILNRTCKTDIGRLCSEFGGGGHKGAGACTLDPASADDKLKEIIQRLKE